MLFAHSLTSSISVDEHRRSFHPAHCFLFGFVRTAERCHYGHEIGEMADASAQCTVDVKGDLIYFNISHPC